MSVKIHKDKKINNVRLGILSISMTRSLLSDKSGRWLAEKIINRGDNLVFHKLIKDNVEEIRTEVIRAVERNIIDSIIILGGTGLSKNDVTVEAVEPMFSKEINGFGFMFSYISYKRIGSSAIMSRAKAGIIDNKPIFCIPGSLDACKLACEQIIFKELEHLIFHVYS